MNTLLERHGRTPVLGPVLRYLNENLGILAGFMAMLVLLSIFADNFLTASNGLNVLRAVSINALLAIGVMLSIMLAGIDLTGGALVALSGVVTVIMLQSYGVPIWLAIVLGVMVGLLAGAVNGSIIALTGIHPFVVTLAMQSICRGASYLLADGAPVPVKNDAFTEIGNGNLWGIPLPAIYMIVAFVALYFFLNKTRTGRHIYAVGEIRPLPGSAASTP